MSSHHRWYRNRRACSLGRCGCTFSLRRSAALPSLSARIGCTRALCVHSSGSTEAALSDLLGGTVETTKLHSKAVSERAESARASASGATTDLIRTWRARAYRPSPSLKAESCGSTFSTPLPRQGSFRCHARSTSTTSTSRGAKCGTASCARVPTRLWARSTRGASSSCD